MSSAAEMFIKRGPASEQNYIATEYIPRKTIRTNTRHQPWMTGNIIAVIKLKHQLFKAYHRLKSSDNWLKYKQQRNKVCSLVRNAKSLFMINLEITADGMAKTNDQKTHQSVTNVPRLHKLLKCLLRQTKAPTFQGLPPAKII